MRFHLIDRIEAWQAYRSIRARKLTSRTEAYWQGPADNGVMPAPLVLEALCQTGSWLVILSTECRQRAALLSIGTLSVLGQVRPGDVLELSGQVDSMNDEVAVFSGRVAVDDRLVLVAEEIMCVLIDAERLEDSTSTAAMARLLTGTERR